MGQLHHECGVAAVYQLDANLAEVANTNPPQNPNAVAGPVSPDTDWVATNYVVRMLQDIQNRGQLAAGLSSFHPNRGQLLDTHKDLGTVAEVFNLSKQDVFKGLMDRYQGLAAIGHVRYATCGKDDRSYAQPFERHHLQKRKWFSFGFNGQLANYRELADELIEADDHHLAREADTEILMHLISEQLSRDPSVSMLEVMRYLATKLDGAYSLAYLDARGEMVVARDPLGIKPMCYAISDTLFAAASESVALRNLGFDRQQIKSLEPGHMLTIRNGVVSQDSFVDNPGRAHCFFEWVYFANVASTLDDVSVYVSRTRLGAELAKLERERPIFEIDDQTIVVPVPDTSKAAADSMAFELGIPSREGLIRNRYSGRTFIENTQQRRIEKARSKYTPLREVLDGKRVILVEDSIVRSTTMRVLLDRIREEGGASEIHVRVACPPIMAPCFYGINIPTKAELFAPRFVQTGKALNPEIEERMAADLGCDSLRYLPLESISTGIGYPQHQLCQACLNGQYPTPGGQQNYDQLVELKIGG